MRCKHGIMQFLDKNPKTRDTKWAHIFYHNCKTFSKLSQYTIKRVNYALGYSKKKTVKMLTDIFACPFGVPLAHIKSGHVEIDPVIIVR